MGRVADAFEPESSNLEGVLIISRSVQKGGLLVLLQTTGGLAYPTLLSPVPGASGGTRGRCQTGSYRVPWTSY